MMNQIRMIIIMTINNTTISILRRCICHHVFLFSGTLLLTSMMSTDIKDVMWMIFHKDVSKCLPFSVILFWKRSHFLSSYTPARLISSMSRMKTATIHWGVKVNVLEKVFLVEIVKYCEVKLFFCVAIGETAV